MTEKSLADFGLEPGSKVRFRRRSNEQWKPATVHRIERDGSIGLRDQKGASCAIRPDHIQIQVRGPRGGLRWEHLA